MKMMSLIIGMLLTSLQVLALAPGEQLNETTFKDQFDQELKITDSTRQILFVSNKAASKLMSEQLSKGPETLNKNQAVYVSDISGMPTLVTKMIALPRMRKFPYKMALDRSGEMTKSWPRKEGQVTVIELNGQKVKEVRYLANSAEVAGFLNAQAQ